MVCFFFNQKTADEMRISDWSSDVCSSDLPEWALLSVQSDPTPKNWRSLLRGYQDTHKALSKAENLDLMRLMRQTGSLDSEYGYSEYAEAAFSRSEERRVGKECVRSSRSRWSPDH